MLVFHSELILFLGSPHHGKVVDIKLKVKNNSDRSDFMKLNIQQQPNRTRHLGHVTGYQPIRDSVFDYMRGNKKVVVGKERKVAEANTKELLRQWRLKAALHRTGAIFIELGDDFSYTMKEHTTKMYDNYKSDPYLVTPYLVTPLFSDTIFFPQQKFDKIFIKIFCFLSLRHVTATNNLLLLNLGALPQTPSLSGTPGLGGDVQPLTNTQYISRSNFSSNQSTMTSDLIPVGKAELTTLAERTEGNAGDAAELTPLAVNGNIIMGIKYVFMGQIWLTPI
eukprot:sb/3467933/